MISLIKITLPISENLKKTIPAMFHFEKNQWAIGFASTKRGLAFKSANVMNRSAALNGDSKSCEKIASITAASSESFAL